MRVLPLILALIVSASMATSIAHAAPPVVAFEGQRYTLAFEDHTTLEDGQMGDAIAEFTLPGETVEDWSKLFAFYAYPQMGDDPAAAVEAVGKAVKEANKDANYAIAIDEETGEAIIDFLTWLPESDVMEFNVFKYARAEDGRGLIAMQFAQHVTIDGIDVEGMRALRQRAVKDMSDMDIDQAQEYFADKRSQSSADAGDDDKPSMAEAGEDN
ncbi:MAG TPA: hypothetical protein VNR51_07240 [Hyphomicrobium sp.]|nr:hypothetical protein [Hyphomicrobium sp.]